MSNWTDELKQQAVDEYLAAEPTSENSAEIVQEIAERMDKTVNGVRMILSKAGVYKAKDPSVKAASASKASGDKAPRVSKEASQQALTAAIEEAGADVDSEIISKLTGKAAVYFTGVIKAAAGGSQED